MQRNIRNEIMIAVGAVLIIGFALVFAVLLSGSPQNDNPATEIAENPTTTAESTDDAITISPTLSVSETVTEAASETAEPSATEALATATENPSLEITATEEEANPSDEPSPEQLVSPTSATATEEEINSSDEPSPEQMASPTEEASSTVERETLATPTRRSSISRPTREATATTQIQPSNTRRSIIVSTNTQRPLATLSPTTVISPTNSVVPSPTNPQSIASGIIPTPPPSPTVPPLNEPSRTPATCQLPQGWTSYVVQSGNTLFAIALATNSTVDELRYANCIDNVDNIQAGDTVFVPIAPLRPVATLVSSGIRANLRAIGCTSPNVQITSPIIAQRLSGTFTVYGTASRSDFFYYKIEIRPDAASIYNFYLDSRTQVNNAALGEINSELFDSGLHWLKLTVVDSSASIPADATCEIPVIFN